MKTFQYEEEVLIYSPNNPLLHEKEGIVVGEGYRQNEYIVELPELIVDPNRKEFSSVVLPGEMLRSLGKQDDL